LPIVAACAPVISSFIVSPMFCCGSVVGAIVS